MTTRRRVQLQPEFIAPRIKIPWDDDFQFWIASGREEHSFPLHGHSFSELVVVHSGRAVHVTDFGEYLLHAGDVFVISGDTVHGYRGAVDCRLTNVKFNPAHFFDFGADVNRLSGFHALFVLEPRYRRQHKFRARLHLGAQEMAYVEELLHLLDREVHERPDGHRSMIRALFSQLVIYLSRNYQRVVSGEQRSLLAIGDALSYLEKHYHEHITLEQLARLSHLSMRQFIRVFKEATAHTPIVYLIRLRVMRATQLLRDPQRSITDVAFAVGFDDSNYFATQFRRIIGSSPRDYRRHNVRV